MKYLDFDLDKARQREAERRLQLLGDCAGKKYDADKLKDRAYATRVPFRTLKGWWQSYRSQGLPGLIPQDWTALDEKSQSIVAKRYEQLGELADAETIVVDQIAFWAERNGWLYRRADRWVQRYRVGGLWALAPHNNPDKLRRPKNPKRSLATLDEAALQEAFRRREILGELADKARVSDDEVRARADQTGVSPRTIWNYLRDYRESGFAGLAPRRRSDHGRRHVISDRMVEIILGIRLSKPDWPVRAVYEAACERARLLDEPEPSEWQVRDIINRIPKPVRLLADGRDDEFRNKYRITYRMRFDAQRLVYQIDHTPIDVLVKDIRGQAYRRASGEIRPWLTLCMDSASRLVMAAIFAYDRPDRFTVAAAIRDSLLVSDAKPYGGIPDEIWIDNGKELLSYHVEQLTRELGITLQPCAPHQPQIKGIVERFFETLNTRLWSRLPGYVASNTVERNPKAKAELTLSELVEEFWSFVAKYSQEVHSETGQTPLDYWREHCFAEPVDPRRLDILLKEPTNRRVTKEGLKYDGRVYWHTALAGLVGQSILVRAEPSYSAPDEIEVFHDGQWICTAFATDSETGRSVDRSQVRAAQRDQREQARHIINRARHALADADREIQESQRVAEPEELPAPPTPSSVTAETKLLKKAKKRKPDLLDRLADREK